MKQLIRLEYSDCFSENPQEISNYFQGICIIGITVC